MGKTYLYVLLVGVMALGGCVRRGPPDPAAPRADPPPAETGRQRLEEKVYSLGLLNKELRQRSEKLSREVNRLRFLNEQLTKQLEVVGDAPRQRDACRQQVVKLELEIERLRAQVRQLEKLLKQGSAEKPK